jgi:biotin carboxylase
MNFPEVVLLDAPSSLGIQVVHCLHLDGFRRLTTVSGEVRSRLRFSRCCRHVLLPGWDWTSGPEALSRKVAIPEGALILPMTTSAIRWCVRHQEALLARWRLTPLPEGKGLEQVIDKVTLGEVGLGAGLRTPRTLRLGDHDPKEMDGFLREVGFPLLLKPVRGSGGIGIHEVRDRGELRPHRIVVGGGEGYCLQEFVTGEDVSCGLVAREGKVVAQVAYVPLTRRDRFGTFRSLRAVEDPAVESAVVRLVAGLKWSGPASLDFRRAQGGGVWLLDFNPRPWGNMRSLLGTGVNFPGLLCRMALGEVPRVERLLPVEYVSPVDALRRIVGAHPWGGAKLDVAIGVRRGGWSFVVRDPGLYAAMGFLTVWDRLRGN